LEIGINRSGVHQFSITMFSTTGSILVSPKAERIIGGTLGLIDLAEEKSAKRTENSK
jgi:hypothetical protein